MNQPIAMFEIEATTESRNIYAMSIRINSVPEAY